MTVVNPLTALVLSLVMHLHCIMGEDFFQVVDNLVNVNKRSPLEIGRTLDNSKRPNSNKWTNKKDDSYPSYSSDSSASKNASWKAFTGNPNEYTIGGVLSGAPGVEFYFTQVLSVSIQILHTYDIDTSHEKCIFRPKTL